MRLHPRVRLDPYAIMRATSEANDDAKIVRMKLEAYDTDKNRDKRLQRRECKTCFYLHGSRLAGQAFTPWNCRVCGTVTMHHCTAIPMVCSDCSTKMHLCRRCGADLDQRERRRKFDFAAIPWTEPKGDDR